MDSSRDGGLIVALFPHPPTRHQLRACQHRPVSGLGQACGGGNCLMLVTSPPCAAERHAFSRARATLPRQCYAARTDATHDRTPQALAIRIAVPR